MDRLIRGRYDAGGRVADALLLALVETGVPVWAVDDATLDGPLGLRPAVAGRAAGARGVRGRPARRPARSSPTPSGPVAVLFGDDGARARRSRAGPPRLRLFAVGVAGVPAIHVEEALWACAEAVVDALRAGGVDFALADGASSSGTRRSSRRDRSARSPGTSGRRTGRARRAAGAARPDRGARAPALRRARHRVPADPARHLRARSRRAAASSRSASSSRCATTSPRASRTRSGRSTRWAARQARARVLLEKMLLEPGRYRRTRLPARELGEGGCGVYQVVPRLGIIGMLAGLVARQALLRLSVTRAGDARRSLATFTDGPPQPQALDDRTPGAPGAGRPGAAPTPARAR